MIHAGRLDHPVERSSHTVPTPKGGGVGIVAGFAAGMLILAWRGAAPGAHPVVAASAALLLGVVSYFDDLFDWPFVAKLGAQAAAALAMMASGVLLSHLALPGGVLLVLAPHGVVTLCLTLGWFLFVTNAVNFMDGLNGLASGCVGLAMLALLVGAGSGTASQAAVLLAAILGFLPFNYPRARIFMGDVGSQVCGLLAAGVALLAAPQPHISLVVPLALLPLLLDAGFTLVRRARQGARLTQAHRGHLYQVAHRAGMPAWAITLIYWVLSAWGGALGLAEGAGKASPLAAAGLVAMLAALPFAAWGFFVARQAKRAGLTVW
jgi:UDP-GlcNAc:undecaprenyl-phosphate GlcNAc-1-phosphate transferase